MRAQRTTLTFLFAVLTAGLLAIPARGADPDVTTADLVTVWGLTHPGEVIPWNYPDHPALAFKGSPDLRVQGLAFGVGSASLDAENRGVVRAAVRDLRQMGLEDDTELLVIGFADRTHEHAEAESLGLHRAKEVRQALVAEGISADHIEVASFGDRYSDAADWQTNRQHHERRAEIWILR